ncbi:uncharacterized protein [Littorina saxatilis]
MSITVNAAQTSSCAPTRSASHVTGGVTGMKTAMTAAMKIQDATRTSDQTMTMMRWMHSLVTMDTVPTVVTSISDTCRESN